MKSPIFIIGNPRSGTTLLRLMLNNHENIVIPPECGFMVWWYDKYADWNSSYSHNEHYLNAFLEDLSASRKIETWSMNINELKKFISVRIPSSYPELTSSIYEFFGLSIGKIFKRWGDKNNFYLNHIRTIKKLFPDAFFIHIIRDGRDVACSCIHLNKKNIVSKYAPNLPYEIEEIAYEWTASIKEIRNSFDLFDWQNTLEIKYEELVVSPESKLKEICASIGEGYDPHMLEYYRNQSAEPAEFLQWKEKLIGKPSSSQVGIYRRELKGSQISLFDSIAKEILSIYSYDL